MKGRLEVQLCHAATTTDGCLCGKRYFLLHFPGTSMESVQESALGRGAGDLFVANVSIPFPVLIRTGFHLKLFLVVDRHFQDAKNKLSFGLQ